MSGTVTPAARRFLAPEQTLRDVRNCIIAVFTKHCAASDKIDLIWLVNGAHFHLSGPMA